MKQTVDSIKSTDVLVVVVNGENSAKFSPMLTEAFRKKGFRVSSQRKNATVEILAMEDNIPSDTTKLFPWIATRIATKKQIPCAFAPIVGVKEKRTWSIKVIDPTEEAKVVVRGYG